MKQVVIDIDGILWNIAPYWHKELIKINPDCPFPGLTTWEFFKKYMSWSEAAAAVTKVHMNQDKYKPFNNANILTSKLNAAGYKTIIASHRHEDSRDVTVRWLRKNNIYFDSLYVGADKHVYLEDKDTVLFIDDCPASQKIAIDKGITTMSIRYPYNEHMYNVIFYEDLDHLISGIDLWLEHQTGRHIGRRVSCALNSLRTAIPERCSGSGSCKTPQVRNSS